jgi:hypothetical protein
MAIVPAPVTAPVTTPVTTPIATPVATPVPTPIALPSAATTAPSAGFIYVEATPFSVEYIPVTGPVVETDIADAKNATCEFIATNAIEPLGAVGFTCTLLNSADTSAAGYVVFSYAVTGVFRNGDVPTVETIDMAIGNAFTDPTVSSLITSLAALPATNPFASTISVVVTGAGVGSPAPVTAPVSDKPSDTPTLLPTRNNIQQMPTTVGPTVVEECPGGGSTKGSKKSKCGKKRKKKEKVNSKRTKLRPKKKGKGGSSGAEVTDDDAEAV